MPILAGDSRSMLTYSRPQQVSGQMTEGYLPGPHRKVGWHLRAQMRRARQYGWMKSLEADDGGLRRWSFCLSLTTGARGSQSMV